MFDISLKLDYLFFGVKKKKAVVFILTVFLAVFCYYRIITTTVLIVYFNWFYKIQQNANVI